MKELNVIEAELTALFDTLNRLDKDFKAGLVSEVFYYKRRVSLVQDHELALNKVKTVLKQNDAGEMCNVLEKVASGAKDAEIQNELNQAQAAGQPKGWGETVKRVLKEHKGSIIQTAVTAALKVAQIFI